MTARIHLDLTLAGGAELALPASASRHLQVLRLQPGAPITVFDGRGGEWSAEVVEMGRKTVTARVLAHQAVERELATPVTLALGMPANERMDWLVEKATELGVTTIVPLVCERSVLRVAGDRAERKAAHWQAIAAASCEQSGRNRVPHVEPPLPLRSWLAACAARPGAERRLVLSLAPGALGVVGALAGAPIGVPIMALSGPEGGLSPAELAAADAAGFAPVSLGARVLRADTAPLALLACIAALEITA
jgi:16S rRNA (uracil1498-N3)-methyltransferase